MRTLSLLLLLVLLAPPLFAQESDRPDPQNPQGENLQTPPAWKVRLDRPSDEVVIGADQEAADIYFVNMTPGWHITTGPAAIFYHPASTAEGTYRAETTIHLFDPGQRNEAFGLFIGGTDLDADAIAYDYFLIRKTGEYLIKRREGSGTSTIQGWTKHDAIQPFGPDTEGPVPNTLAVEVGEETVNFYVNDEQVASRPRAEIQTDGIVGLRINHALNVHVEDFKVE